MTDLSGQASVGNTRDLLFGSGDPGAALSVNRSTASGASDVMSQVGGLLRKYQQGMQQSGYAAQQQQFQRQGAQVDPSLIGASPQQQQQVRNADVGALDPTIGGLRAGVGEIGDVLSMIKEHETQRRQFQNDALTRIHQAITTGGGNVFDGLDPKIKAQMEKDAGVTPGYIQQIAQGVKTKELQAQLQAKTNQLLLSGEGGYARQDRLEQQFRTQLTKVYQARSGELGLQAGKVDQAIHLLGLASQSSDSKTGGLTISGPQYEELAIGLANLVSGTSGAAQSTIQGIMQRTAKGDFNGALTYVLGMPKNASTQAIYKNLVDSIKRQGNIAEKLRNKAISGLNKTAPTGLNSDVRDSVYQNFIDELPSLSDTSLYKGQDSTGGGTTPSKQVNYKGKLYNVDANGDMTPAQ